MANKPLWEYDGEAGHREIVIFSSNSQKVWHVLVHVFVFVICCVQEQCVCYMAWREIFVF